MGSRWSPRSWLPFVSGQRHFPGLGTVHFDPRSAREVEFIFHEIFDHGDYRADALALPDAPVVFDVGANIGLFTLFVATRLAPTARIYAFEPIPQTFAHLERNLAEHGLGDRARAFNVGLTHDGGPTSLELTHYPFLPGNSTADPAHKAREFAQFIERWTQARPWAARLLGPTLRQQMATQERVLCPMRTLDAVIREEGIAQVDLLKIDVEGAEHDVLRGLAPDGWARVQRVAVETHDIGGRVAALEALLRAQGFASVKVERPRFTDTISIDNRVIHAWR